MSDYEIGRSMREWIELANKLKARVHELEGALAEQTHQNDFLQSEIRRLVAASKGEK